MSPIDDLYKELYDARSVRDAWDAIESFTSEEENHTEWKPIGGKENNIGVIRIARDAGRALIERITNGIDAVLEDQFLIHSGNPKCSSPEEAARAWLAVPEAGLSALSPAERRARSKNVVIRISADEGGDNGRTIEVRDLGIGLTAEEMPRTILSLNENNKMGKRYLMGIYGQGGSTTLSFAKCIFIASRRGVSGKVAFTFAKYLELDPEVYKTGHYVYLTTEGRIPEVNIPVDSFPPGTLVKHFAYDLYNYQGSLGPSSMYGLLNQVLFNPVMPIWLEDRVHGNNRTIKGSRNALSGPLYDEDEKQQGPKISYSLPMFYVSLGSYGNIGVEYWVLAKQRRDDGKPMKSTAAFVNPAKPILLTLNGQSHSELSSNLIKKNANLPYLANRLICHVRCDQMAPSAKENLFISSREEARQSDILRSIEAEIVQILKSDDELTRLNDLERQLDIQIVDEQTRNNMRKEIAMLLRPLGTNQDEVIISGPGQGGLGSSSTVHPPRGSHKNLIPISLHEPPTFIRIVDKEPITFHRGQRKYIRVETDANDQYHNADDPSKSRINIISDFGELANRGSSHLHSGRMRVAFECLDNAKVGDTGKISVELSRTGWPVLSDTKNVQVVEPPPVHEGRYKIDIPDFTLQPLTPDSGKWASLGWPEEVDQIALEPIDEDGKFVIYYSNAFPQYKERLDQLEAKDLARASSFTRRYETWLAVYSFLMKKDQESQERPNEPRPTEDEDAKEKREMEERCRAAKMAAMVAWKEVQDREVEAGEGSSS